MSFSEHVKMIQFDRTRRAYGFFTTENTTPQDIILELPLNPLPNGVICISGGATMFPSNTVDKMIRLSESSIAPLVDKYGLLIVDGGTEAGVMQITGKVLRKFKYGSSTIDDASQKQIPDYEELPLMGFVPESKVIYPGAEPSSQREIPLEPNHKYFVLVKEAQDWGEEVEHMFRFINYLAGRNIPIVHIIANGGRITIKGAYHSARQGHPIIILEGSERATKIIIAALDGASETELINLLEEHKITKHEHEVEETLVWLKEIAKYNKITRFDLLSRNPEKLKKIIVSLLESPIINDDLHLKEQLSEQQISKGQDTQDVAQLPPEYQIASPSIDYSKILKQHEPEHAQQAVDRFVQRFQPSYRRLVYYTALPLVLTPELVNYLRNQFLREEDVPWAAEVDLLLSDLCRQVGYELYAMDTAVRAYALAEMKREIGTERMQQVAQLLLDYVKQLWHTMPSISSHELQAQQWAAMVYLDDKRENVVKEIVTSFQKSITQAETTTQGAHLMANRAEMSHLSHLVQTLSSELEQYPELVEYANIITDLLTNPAGVQHEQVYREWDVLGEKLPGLDSLLIPTNSHVELSEDQTYFFACPFTQEFHKLRDTITEILQKKYGVKLTTTEMGATTVVESIKRQIAESYFGIADITGNIPNVLWDLGVMIGYGKPVILLKNRQDTQVTPFDLYGDYRLTYDTAKNSLTGEIRYLFLEDGLDQNLKRIFEMRELPSKQPQNTLTEYRSCFFAYRFEQEFHVLRDVISRVLQQQYGIKLTATSLEQRGANVVEDIKRQITEAHFGIADITGNSPNVLWELGVMIGVGKPVIILKNQTGTEATPFDVYGEYRLIYQVVRDPLTGDLEYSLLERGLERNLQRIFELCPELEHAKQWIG